MRRYLSKHPWSERKGRLTRNAAAQAATQVELSD